MDSPASTIFVTRSRHTFRVLDFSFWGKPPVRDKASGPQQESTGRQDGKKMERFLYVSVSAYQNTT